MRIWVCRWEDDYGAVRADGQIVEFYTTKSDALRRRALLKLSEEKALQVQAENTDEHGYCPSEYHYGEPVDFIVEPVDFENNRAGICRLLRIWS